MMQDNKQLAARRETFMRHWRELNGRRKPVSSERLAHLKKTAHDAASAFAQCFNEARGLSVDADVFEWVSCGWGNARNDSERDVLADYRGIFVNALAANGMSISDSKSWFAEAQS